MTRYVALYCRISVDRAGRSEGVQAQERWGRAYAARVWPGVPVQVFADNDLSAADDNVVRPEYDLLREALGRGEVAQVWCVEQYRLERREIAWFELAALMDEAGISELHTNRDGVVRVRDDVAGIKAVLGAGEVRRLKRRVNDTLAEKAALGEPPGGNVFGYRRATTEDGTKTFVIVPEEAEAIRQAAEWVLSGWSLTHIASELGRRGLRGKFGGTIRGDAVRGLLLSPSIAGHRVYRGQVVARGNWPPIVDDQTWLACRLMLTQPRQVTGSNGRAYSVTDQHKGSTGRRYLLTGGLAVCGVCENRMSGTMITMNKQRVSYLRCHSNVGGKGCTGILLDKTEKHVVKRMFEELDKPEFLNAVAADEHGARRDEIVRALAAVDRQRGELAAMWATPGELTAIEWREARQGLTENEQRLRAELAELPPPVIDVDVAAAREGWEDMTLDEQRGFVRLFVERVTVYRSALNRRRVFDPDTRIKIKWKFA